MRSDWQQRDPDDVAAMGLTADDVPIVLQQMRAWAQRTGWSEDPDDVSGMRRFMRGVRRQNRGARGAVPVVLDLLDPLQEAWDAWSFVEFSLAFALIGPASMTPLRAYLEETRHGACAGGDRRGASGYAR